MMMRRRLAIAGLVLASLAAPAVASAEALQLRLRARVAAPEPAGAFALVERPAAWDPTETAIIVCDMWDAHHCLNAVRRGKELAPTMEKVLKTLRQQGAAVIHAPSGCMDAYKDHPARAHALKTPRAADLPKEIGVWCKQIPSEEKGTYPIDQTDGGEDDDPAAHREWAAELAALGRNPRAPWKSQTDMLTIKDDDYVSDNGEEIWSILEARRIKHVVLVGVHLNMCVLGRPFGLRQMAKNGKDVVLMRDMTDTMYNPERAPYVSHFAGTDLMVEHVEKYVCPTITSNQVVGGAPFHFSGDPRPRVVFVIAEDEYKTERSLPAFASAHLLKSYAVDYVLNAEGDRDNLPTIGLLKDADLAFISARRRVLPKAQVDAIRAYVASGKPVVGIRTASHAFAPRKGEAIPEGRDAWATFDPDVLGGHYTNHHGAGTKVAISVAPGAASHPILKGIDAAKLVGNGSLYKVSPLEPSATPLLLGTIPGAAVEPVAWVNDPPATRNRVVYTSLGQIADFAEPGFNALLRQAIDWAAHPTPAPVARNAP